MRTTITLDADVEALLKKLIDGCGVSFKEAANGLLRDALAPARQATFPTYDLGLPSAPVERRLQVAADLEDEEIVRKFSAGR